MLDARGDAPNLLWRDQPRVELWACNAFLAGGAVFITPASVCA